MKEYLFFLVKLTNKAEDLEIRAPTCSERTIWLVNLAETMTLYMRRAGENWANMAHFFGEGKTWGR